jgi:hypothetical protein
MKKKKNNKPSLTLIEVIMMIGVALASMAIALSATYVLNLITK